MTTGVLPLYPSSSASLLAKLNIIIENTIDHPSIGVAFCIPEPSRQQICRVQKGPICTPMGSTEVRRGAKRAYLHPDSICAGRRVSRAWACGRLPAPSGAVGRVRGRAGAMGMEADKAAGCGRTGIFLPVRPQPCRLRRKPRFAGVWGPRIISQIVPG